MNSRLYLKVRKIDMRNTFLLCSLWQRKVTVKVFRKIRTTTNIKKVGASDIRYFIYFFKFTLKSEMARLVVQKR